MSSSSLKASEISYPNTSVSPLAEKAAIYQLRNRSNNIVLQIAGGAETPSNLSSLAKLFLGSFTEGAPIPEYARADFNGEKVIPWSDPRILKAVLDTLFIESKETAGFHWTRI
jgi:hypothetical protein